MDVERAEDDVRDVVIVELVKVRWLRNIFRVDSSLTVLQQKILASQR